MFKRTAGTVTATIANGAALSDAIEFDAASMVVIHMPAAWTAASIGFHVSSTRAGTFQPLYDSSGLLVEIASPAVSKSYTAPAELAPARFFKLWSQTAGSGVNQGGERSIVVDVKP